ncbi:unnamed protein product [Effrenium voratum]|nr:unnamed protein product [Effrenium voratum]
MEQQREDSRMALQFALRRGEVGALQVALSEAKKVLADGGGLMAEAGGQSPHCLNLEVFRLLLCNGPLGFAKDGGKDLGRLALAGWAVPGARVVSVVSLLAASRRVRRQLRLKYGQRGNMDVAPQAVGCGEPEERQSRHEPEEAADGHFRLILCAFLALFLTGVLYLMAGRRGRSETLLQSNPLQSLTETPVHLLYTLDENLGKLRQFNDAAFHKFSPVVPFEALGSDVFLVGVMGSGLTLLTQIGHQLRSNGSMSFEDLNEVVPWFHAALLCGQDLDEAQAFPPRLYKTHQRYEKLPEGAKFVVLFRDPEDVLWTRYQRYCNSSWTEYARVPKAAIALEDFAAGMFAHKSSNEVWHFMKSWLSCCMGHDRVPAPQRPTAPKPPRRRCTCWEERKIS